jgi:hypothetical protein
MQAFELMHQILDRVWDEVCRVVKGGGFVCINIGDATRTISGDFTLYPKGDLILDPFLGTGTTIVAGMVSARNTVGFEIDKTLNAIVNNVIHDIKRVANSYISDRLNNHSDFVELREQAGEPIKHHNKYYDLPVIMSQERELYLNEIVYIEKIQETLYEVIYSDTPENCSDFVVDKSGQNSCNPSKRFLRPSKKNDSNRGAQLALF